MRHLLACCPFRVSWLSVSFPLAASAIAGLRYAMALPSRIADFDAVLLLTLASIVISALLVRTVFGLVRG